MSAGTRADFARRYRVNFGGVFIAPARERLTKQKQVRYKDATRNTRGTREGMKMTPGERKHIRAALREAANVGFYPVYVYDGEARQRGAAQFMLDSEVLAACESVDDSHIHFVNLNSQQSRQWARVILGNARDGSEVIADNSCSNQLFDAAMSRAMGIPS